MRKLMLVFLMLLLPLQWTAALAADCCLRHDAQTQEHHQSAQAAHGDHAQMHAGHTDHHAKADEVKKSDIKKSDLKSDSQQAKADCDMQCSGCHAHHCPAAVLERTQHIAKLSSVRDDTPYLSSVTTPLPDNLFRPPLSSLA